MTGRVERCADLPPESQVRGASWEDLLAVVVLYAVNLWMRRRSLREATLPVWLSAGSLVLLTISGWLGGELVFVHGVSVEPGRVSATIDVAPGAQRASRADDARRPA
jgi:hypothetical protein